MSLRDAFAVELSTGQVDRPTYKDIVRHVRETYLVGSQEATTSDDVDPSNPHVARRRRVAQRLRLYRDSYQRDLEKIIERLFEHERNQLQRKKLVRIAMELNVTARIVDEISVVYDAPPQRVFDDPDTQKAFAEVARQVELDETMDQAHKLTTLCREVLIWASTSAATNERTLRVITPDAFDVIPHPQDSLVPAGYLIDWAVGRPISANKPHAEDLPAYRLWDDEVYVTISAGGYMIGEPVEHGFGRIPGVLCHAAKPLDSILDATTGEDITSAHLRIAFLSVLAARLAKSQGERQPVLEGVLAGMAKGQAADGEAPLQLPPDVRAYMLNSKTDPDHYLKLRRDAITGVGLRYGISYERFTFAETTSNSARDLKLRDKKLTEIRRRQVPRWARIEHEVVELLGFDPVESGFYWNPAETQIALEPKDERELLKTDVQLGLDSVLEYMMRKDPELTEARALRLWLERLKRRIFLVKLQRAMNMPSDPADPGQDPHVNGAGDEPADGGHREGGGDEHSSAERGNDRASSTDRDTGEVKFFQYELEGGLVTINEVRTSKGLPPIPDGDLTLPEFRAKRDKVFSHSTLTQAASSAEKIAGLDDE